MLVQLQRPTDSLQLIKLPTPIPAVGLLTAEDG